MPIRRLTTPASASGSQSFIGCPKGRLASNAMLVRQLDRKLDEDVAQSSLMVYAPPNGLLGVCNELVI